MNKRLNLLGSVSGTGYGVVTFNILKYMTEQGWDISLFPKGGTDRTNPEEISLISNAVNRSKTFDFDAPCLNIWHQFDLANHIGYGKYVAYPFFELDTLKPLEIHHLNYPDELIVSSEWARLIVEQNGVTTKTNVIPPGVDLIKFNPNKQYDSNYHNDNTVFLNCGKWEVRKGHDILVDVFNDAFEPTDNVELWMMPTNVFLNETETKAWESLYLNSNMGRAGKIKILPWCKTHGEVAATMAKADCGVFPARAEGFNLELLEILALGKPVIATYYSAHTEFINNDNAYLITIDDVELAYDGRWFNNEGHWAYIGDSQIEQCVEHMRTVHKWKQDGKNMHSSGGVETAQKFCWENTAEKIGKILLT